MTLPTNEQNAVQPVAHSKFENMITIKDVAAMLKVAPLTVHRMIARNTFPVYRVGGRRLRFKVDDIIRYIEANKYGGS